jgi:hypothetical protein
VQIDDLEGKMPSLVEKKKEVDSEASQLSERDIRLLLFLCADLVNFCAKITRKIDPAASAMLANCGTTSILKVNLF